MIFTLVHQAKEIPVQAITANNGREIDIWEINPDTKKPSDKSPFFEETIIFPRVGIGFDLIEITGFILTNETQGTNDPHYIRKTFTLKRREGIS